MGESSSNFFAPFRGRHQRTMLPSLIIVLLTAGLVRSTTPTVLDGEPPSFIRQPEDKFVFSVDAEGNPVTLRFDCPVEGDPTPTIRWFRSGVEDTENVNTTSGSFERPNIDDNTGFASGSGVEYNCTATNDFGTIRSTTVRAFYAFFAGFEQRESEVTVDVIMDHDVALECAFNDGSNPTPNIQWVQCSTCDGSDDTVLEDSMGTASPRYLDGGRYIYLDVTSDVLAQRYTCIVINSLQFQTARFPTTYTLNEVTSFNESKYENGLRIYKALEDISALVVPSEDEDTVVMFSIVAAREGSLSYLWELLDDNDPRLMSSTRPFASVRPIFLDDDTTPTIMVQAALVFQDIVPQHFTANLRLLEPARITSSPDDIRDSLTGATHTFSCPVTGNPTPDVTWYFNGDPLEGDEGRVIAGSELTVGPTMESHSGMYQCFATNDNGVAYESWTLQVRVPVGPEITVSFAENVVECLDFPLIQQDTAPVELAVNVTADPCPQVNWFLNETLISGGTSGIETTDPCADPDLPPGYGEFKFTLTVTTLDPTTTGFYTATFTNEGGEVSVTPTFVTPFNKADIVDLRSEPYHPIADSEDGEVCLLAGSTVEVVCEHVSYPVATVRFTKDGSDVEIDDDRVRQVCDRLIISPVEPDDTGTYRCFAQNEPDDQAEDTEGPLRLQYCTKPVIVEEVTFTNSNPEEGDETSARCEWSGEPEPDVNWFKDDEPLDQSDLPDHIRITPLDNEGVVILEILSVELGDAGEYKCNVSNAVGFDHQIRRLEVREKDEPPLGRIAIVGVSSGIAGFIVLATFVLVMLCCVWYCASRSSGAYEPKNNIPMSVMGPETFNVDAPDGLEDPEEAFSPDYASLPAVRPAHPPQYKPTPHYGMEEETMKMPPPDDEFVGPYGGQDNGGVQHQGRYQPSVDDFVSEDAQFV